MSEDKDNARDEAVEAFLKSVMGSASTPSEPAADAGTEAAPTEATAPPPAAQAGAAPARAAVPKVPLGAGKVTPMAGSQTVTRKAGPVPAPGSRTEAQKMPPANVKSSSYPAKSGPVPQPVPAPVQAAKVIREKNVSPVPMLNLVANVVLLLLFMVLLAMLANLKSALVRQDNAISKLREAMEKVQTMSQVKFGVVQDPKRGLLGVFVDGNNPSSYKVVDLKEEQ